MRYRRRARMYDFFLRYGVRRPIIRSLNLDWNYPIHEVEWLDAKEEALV